MDALRRKFAQRSKSGVPDGNLDGFGLALARAARSLLSAMPEIGPADLRPVALAEVVAQVPDNALVLLLRRETDAGCLVVPAALLSGLVEVTTTGGVSIAPVVARRPTRTDAAMVSGLFDAALSDLAGSGVSGSGPVWRTDGFLPDAKALALALTDTGFTLWSAAVALGDGSRSGTVLLALPRQAATSAPQGEPDSFGQALASRVDGAEARLDAVIARVALPLSRLVALEAGDTLQLQGASVDAVRLAGADGRIIAEGRLGQIGGKRALRLSGAVAAPAERPAAPESRAAG